MATPIKIWALYQGGDDRNIGEPVEFYSSYDKAVVAAKGRGWYGGNAPIREKSAIVADGATYWLASSKPIDLDLCYFAEQERVKQAALAKLSSAEKAALGL